MLVQYTCSREISPEKYSAKIYINDIKQIQSHISEIVFKTIKIKKRAKQGLPNADRAAFWK